MATIWWLTIRQLTGRRRFVAVVALAAVPMLLAIVYLFSAAATRPSAARYLDRIEGGLTLSTVLPLVVLLLATASFGDEMEDRTLLYLALKPIPRWAIALPKLAAPLAVATLLLVPSGVVSTLLITGGDGGAAATTAAATLAAVVAYSAIFTWGGLAFRNALAAGLVYVFLWEASLSGLFAGVRFLSVRQYAQGVMRGLDASRLPDANIDVTLAGALFGVAAVLALFTVLTVRRLRGMEIP